ncbi:MAG: hypothetical protein HYU66_26420 [Armatimonadetes bacterium]|nr:hypothetical protein [Armatimonadota bacterium]
MRWPDREGNRRVYFGHGGGSPAGRGPDAGRWVVAGLAAGLIVLGAAGAYDGIGLVVIACIFTGAGFIVKAMVSLSLSDSRTALRALWRAAECAVLFVIALGTGLSAELRDVYVTDPAAPPAAGAAPVLTPSPVTTRGASPRVAQSDGEPCEYLQHKNERRQIPKAVRVSRAPALPDGPAEDSFSAALRTAIRRPAHTDSKVTPHLPSLRRLARENRSLLLRYLATNPAWCLSRDGDGALTADRRVKSAGLWQSAYFYEQAASGHDWQFALTIHFDGPPRVAEPSKEIVPEPLEEGGPGKVIELTPSDRLEYSRCFVVCGPVGVELEEWSSAPERRLTKAALRLLDAEVSRVIARGQVDRTVLPTHATRHGEPKLLLYRTDDDGGYSSEAWVNPGEPGCVYLKAFDVRTGRRLKGVDLQSTNERTGWSDDPDELFVCTSCADVLGGGHSPFGALYELWFVPDSGGPERKLVERAFRVAQSD